MADKSQLGTPAQTDEKTTEGRSLSQASRLWLALTSTSDNRGRGGDEAFLSVMAAMRLIETVPRARAEMYLDELEEIEERLPAFREVMTQVSRSQATDWHDEAARIRETARLNAFLQKMETTGVSIDLADLVTVVETLRVLGDAILDGTEIGDDARKVLPKIREVLTKRTIAERRAEAVYFVQAVLEELRLVRPDGVRDRFLEAVLRLTMNLESEADASFGQLDPEFVAETLTRALGGKKQPNAPWVAAALSIEVGAFGDEKLQKETPSKAIRRLSNVFRNASNAVKGT